MTTAAKQAAAALRRIDVWSKKCAVPYAGDDYLNGDDGRSDGKDAWDDLDEIVAGAIAALEAEAAQPNPEPITVSELIEWMTNRPQQWTVTIACVRTALSQIPAREHRGKATQVPEERETK